MLVERVMGPHGDNMENYVQPTARSMKTFPTACFFKQAPESKPDSFTLTACLSVILNKITNITVKYIYRCNIRPQELVSINNEACTSRLCHVPRTCLC